MEKSFSLFTFYKIPENFNFSKSDFLYHSSMIPEISKLKKVKKINFIVSLRPKFPNSLKKIPNHNDINHHLFKPNFYYDKRTNDIYCYVSSEDVLIHSLRSIALISYFIINKKMDIQININYDSTCYSQIITNLRINKSLLIGRVQSALSFFRILWLLEHSSIPRFDIKKIAFLIERSRLNNDSIDINRYIEDNYLKNYSLSFEIIDANLNLKIEKKNTKYLEITHLVYKRTPITIAQLQWSAFLTKSLVKTILKSENNLEKVGIVGGVGYLGKHNEVEIDDIFVPVGITLSKNRLEKINNMILKIRENKYFNKKKVWYGFLKTVTPEIGLLSYTKKFFDNTKKIYSFDAVDMEKEFFMELLKKENIKWASIYYIMDMASKGKKLGDTYYNRKFLNRLFSKFNRGKYYCYEKIINFLVS